MAHTGILDHPASAIRERRRSGRAASAGSGVVVIKLARAREMLRRR